MKSDVLEMYLISLFCGIIQTIYIVILINTIWKKKIFSFNYTCLLIYYFLFSIPLMLDATLGIADYTLNSQYIYQVASENNRVIATFNLVNTIVFFILYKYRKEFMLDFKIKKNVFINLCLMLTSLLPIVLLIANYDVIPSYKYGALMGASKYYTDYMDLHNLFLSTTIISVVSGMVYIILNPKRHPFISLLIYLSIILGIYLNGKRLVVFIFICLLIVHVFINFKSKKIILATAICSVVFIFAYNSYYSSYVENEYNLNKFNRDSYLSYRLDYSRDHNMKMVLYKELYTNEAKVLDYRGQSFLYNMTFFVPREIWPEKPYPYGIYVTAASLGLTEITNLGWQMTTSLLDESISNFGIISGVIFFLIIITLINRIGHYFKDDILVFSSTNFILLLVLTMQFSFSIIFIIFWLLLIVTKYISNKQTKNTKLISGVS